MFDKRLMTVCPKSKKYISGNIILQFLELVCNTVMIITIAQLTDRLYNGNADSNMLVKSVFIILITVPARFFTSKYAVNQQLPKKYKLSKIVYTFFNIYID